MKEMKIDDAARKEAINGTKYLIGQLDFLANSQEGLSDKCKKRILKNYNTLTQMEAFSDVTYSLYFDKYAENKWGKRYTWGDNLEIGCAEYLLKYTQNDQEEFCPFKDCKAGFKIDLNNDKITLEYKWIGRSERTKAYLKRWY